MDDCADGGGCSRWLGMLLLQLRLSATRRSPKLEIETRREKTQHRAQHTKIDDQNGTSKTRPPLVPKVSLSCAGACTLQ